MEHGVTVEDMDSILSKFRRAIDTRENLMVAVRDFSARIRPGDVLQCGMSDRIGKLTELSREAHEQDQRFARTFRRCADAADLRHVN
jgi:hypothetical protein